MKHCKIKCKKEKDYAYVRDVLDMNAVEYYQRAPGKAIHLCGFDKKKDVEAMLDNWQVKHAKVTVEKPDFEEER